MTLFNFNNYFDNPIVDFCVSQYKNKTVYTLDDLMPEIQKLKHSKWALEQNMLSFVGDELRLYLSTLENDFFYVDADVYLTDLPKILENKNCTDYISDKKFINNGTFFYSNKNCEFNNYYLDIYENVLPVESYNTINVEIFRQYPFHFSHENRKSGDMNLIENTAHHFLMSRYNLFKSKHPDIDKVFYTRNPLKGLPGMTVWCLCEDRQLESVEVYKNYEVYKYNCNVDFMSQDDAVRLWKEQLNYTMGRKLKFIEF